MKKTVLFFIFFFCSFGAITAQEDLSKYTLTELDSILNSLSNNNAYHLLLPYAQVGVEKATKEFGTQDTIYARMAYFLGFGYHVQQDMSNAELYYKKAIEIQKTKSPKHVKYAASLMNLGILYSTAGRYADAENVYKKAMLVYKETSGLKHSNYALSLNNLASLYLDMGRYDDAEKLFKESIKIKKEVYGTKHPDYAAGLNNLANVYIDMGYYEAAESLYKEAMAIRKATLGPKDPRYAQSLTNMATLFSKMGHYSDAEPLIRQALNISAEVLGTKSYDYVTNLENLAVLYSRMDKYADAEPLFKESLALRKEIFGVNHPMYGNTLSSLANLYSITERYADAERLYREALNIKKEVCGVKHPVYAGVLANIGIMSEELKRYDEAERIFIEVNTIYKDNYSAKHPLYISSLTFLANFYKNTKRYEKSWKYIQEAIIANTGTQISLNISQSWSDSLAIAHYVSIDRMVVTLKTAYEIFNASKDFKNQELITDLILTILKRNRDNFSSEDDKLLNLVESSKWTLKGLKTLDKSTQIERAFSFAEQNKSVLLLEAAKADYAHTFGELPDSLIHQQDALQKQRSKLEADLLENLPPQAKDSLLNTMNHLNVAIKEFKKNIEKNYPKYAALKYKAHDVSIKEVQTALDAKTALLEYVIGDSVIYIFYIDKQNAKLVESFVGTTELTIQIKKLHNSLSNYAFIAKMPKDAYEEYTQAAHWFYKNLVQPALSKAKNIEHLIIVSDGELGHLPFEAFLVTPADQKVSNYADLHYLVKDYNISYNYSATLFVESQEDLAKRTNQKTTNGQLLAMVANYNKKLPDSTSIRLPAYQRLRATLQPLPAAENEVKMLEGIFPGSFLFDEMASEKTFKEKAADYSIIHLAMHGLLDNKAPVLSSLAFTEDGDSVENNFLQAFEISKLKLNADLVVLSACETGYGRFEHGNGIASLARAFMYAGAASMVVSLWQVNDYSTAEIMKDFYQNLKKEMPKDVALRQAKLDYLKKANGIAAHPAFWSAFIQLGNSRPIVLGATRGLPRTWAIAIGLLILSISILVYRKKRSQ